MKILVISNTPWSVDIVLEILLAHFLRSISDLNSHKHMYRQNSPKNDLDMTYYQSQ